MSKDITDPHCARNDFADIPSSGHCLAPLFKYILLSIIILF